MVGVNIVEHGIATSIVVHQLITIKRCVYVVRYLQAAHAQNKKASQISLRGFCPTWVAGAGLEPTTFGL